jgi:hypothetical protein
VSYVGISSVTVVFQYLTCVTVVLMDYYFGVTVFLHLTRGTHGGCAANTSELSGTLAEMLLRTKGRQLLSKISAHSHVGSFSFTNA